MSIDECVIAHDRECTEPKWQLVPYFCGHDARCRSRSSWAVEKAKENIDKYFTFVGILEDLEGSLEVMENILPRYFKDAREVKHAPSSIKNDTFTLHKTAPSAATQEFLRYGLERVQHILTIFSALYVYSAAPQNPPSP